MGWARGCTRDVSHFWSALSEIRPLVTRCVGESVRHGTVGTVDHTGRARVLDTWYGLLLWVDSLRDYSNGLMARLFTENLRVHDMVRRNFASKRRDGRT